MSNSLEVVLPDIGDYKDVPIVEINVAVGDEIAIDTPLLSIESDKATMEVPSPAAGRIKQLMIEVGSRVSQGALLMVLEGAGASASVVQAQPTEAPPTPAQPNSPQAPRPAAPATTVESHNSPRQTIPSATHASPSVRSLARELGVALDGVTPTGPKGRILRADVANHVKGALSAPHGKLSGQVQLDWPKVDFEKFGPIKRQPLSRIQKLTGANLSRNWNVIPHVTNFDKADITDAETFRKIVNGQSDKSASKLTMVSFLIKAAAVALKKYPRFNASLEQDELVLKQYVHVGFAADTPTGLVVPVIRDCDKKGLLEIASEMRALADKAIAGQLSASDMQGGCFSVSSIGGVGGAGFTPIINAPEVAILGAGRSATEAVWNGTEFQPRSILPVSLSWDHRVVDGVAAAQFLGFITAVLSDLRRYAL